MNRKQYYTALLQLLITTVAFSQLPIKPERTETLHLKEGTNMSVNVAPNGKTILFEILGNLCRVSAKGGKAHQLTMGLATHLKPVFSPDGKRFVCYSDERGEYGLMI